MVPYPAVLDLPHALVPHRVSCRVVGVSEAWFYKWRRRPDEPTKREVRRARLEERIIHFFTESGGTYGSPRITLDLWGEGWQVSVNTVAEIMAELGLQGRKPPRRRSLTRQGKRKAAPDLVNRRFDAVAPDVLWYGDMTEIETGEGKIYLATVIDAFSRRCLGYAMGEHHDAALVGASLKMATTTRGGRRDGTIFHSGRGSEGGFNWSSQHFDLGGGRRGHGGLESEDQRYSGEAASAVAR
ncbi:IS3 family transposase [Streptomyces sp. NBC_00441]|uniref:IS3 family transposase n=1 Tax=Streptomyces sp. NBC_00441 TaxID=2975742 RepID=UPI002E2D43C6|nr:IS3 family transposase [Streptomyces sp. NBC_00441]